MQIETPGTCVSFGSDHRRRDAQAQYRLLDASGQACRIGRRSISAVRARWRRRTEFAHRPMLYVAGSTVRPVDRGGRAFRHQQRWQPGNCGGESCRRVGPVPEIAAVPEIAETLAEYAKGASIDEVVAHQSPTIRRNHLEPIYRRLESCHLIEDAT